MKNPNIIEFRSLAIVHETDSLVFSAAPRCHTIDLSLADVVAALAHDECEELDTLAFDSSPAASWLMGDAS